MSLEVYKILHLTGIFFMLISLGGATLHVSSGGTRANNPWRAKVGMGHGVGLFLALLGGFGMLAKYGIHWPWPSWIFLKVGIWIVLGASLTLVYRFPSKVALLWWLIVLFCILAAVLGVSKVSIL